MRIGHRWVRTSSRWAPSSAILDSDWCKPWCPAKRVKISSQVLGYNCTTFNVANGSNWNSHNFFRWDHIFHLMLCSFSVLSFHHVLVSFCCSKNYSWIFKTTLEIKHRIKYQNKIHPTFPKSSTNTNWWVRDNKKNVAECQKSSHKPSDQWSMFQL